MSARVLSATLRLRLRSSSLAVAQSCVCSRLHFSTTTTARAAVKWDDETRSSSSKSERTKPLNDTRAPKPSTTATRGPADRLPAAESSSSSDLRSTSSVTASKRPRRRIKSTSGSPQLTGDTTERTAQASSNSRSRAPPRSASNRANIVALSSATVLEQSQQLERELQAATEEYARAQSAAEKLHGPRRTPSAPSGATVAHTFAYGKDSIPSVTSFHKSLYGQAGGLVSSAQQVSPEIASPQLETRRQDVLLEEINARQELEKFSKMQLRSEAVAQEVPEFESLTIPRPAQGVPIGRSVNSLPNGSFAPNALSEQPYTRPPLADPEQHPLLETFGRNVYSEGQYDQFTDPEMFETRYPSYLQAARLRTRSYVAFLIDGDSCWFKPEFMNQGAHGASQVMSALRNHLQKDEAYDEHTAFRVVVFSNLRGLTRTLDSRDICAATDFRQFVSTMNSLDPLNVFCDAGFKSQAADIKVKAHLDRFVYDSDCKQVYLGGLEDHGYRQDIAALKPLNLLHKVSLLSIPHRKSTEEYYKAYQERNVKWASELFFSSQATNEIKEQDRLIDARAKGANEHASLPDDTVRPRIRAAQNNTHFCTHHFLDPRGCLRENCKFSHGAITEEELADLKLHAEFLRRSSR